MGLKVNRDTSSTHTGEGSVRKKAPYKKTAFGLFKMSTKRKELFYSELSLLLNSGIRLKDALQIKIESQNSKGYTAFLESLALKIAKGMEFSKVMKESGYFTDYECYSIQIGEQTGSLNQVCENLASFFERRNKQKRLIIGALTYPLIVIVITVLVVAILLRFVVPIFQDMFAQNDVELPRITQVVIDFSDILKAYGFYILIGIFILGYGFNFLYSKSFFKNRLDRFVLFIPFIGPITKISQTSRFLDAMTLLVSSKVTIPESISLSSKMIGFSPLKQALDNVYREITIGSSLGDSFKKEAFFDSRITALIRVAEETNESEKVFEQLSKQYNQTLDHKSNQLMIFIQPILLLFVGIIVGIIVIAMYMPLFKMGSVFE